MRAHVVFALLLPRAEIQRARLRPAVSFTS
jgi:hypothetical protein